VVTAKETLTTPQLGEKTCAEFSVYDRLKYWIASNHPKERVSTQKQERNATTSTIKEKIWLWGFFNLFLKCSRCAAFESYFLGMTQCTNPSL